MQTEIYQTETLPNNTIKITKYTGSDTNVIIPTKINKLKVTEIGAEAFANKNLTSVIIPNNIEYICAGAFVNNDNLTSVVVDKRADVSLFAFECEVIRK